MCSHNRCGALYSSLNQSRRFRKAANHVAVEKLENRVLLSTVVVNTIADSTDPVGCATVSLRDAVAVADASTSPTTITFDPTVFATAQTITLSNANGPLVLSNVGQGTTITGPTAAVTVDGNGTWTAFDITANVTASLSGLTVTDTVPGQPPATSGVIYNAGNLTVNNDNFTVGGIDNAATMAMTNDTLSAFVGAGIGNEITGAITLGNVTITGLGNNSTLGFYNLGNATLNNVSISQVQTGINNSGGNLTATNITIAGNLTVSGINNAGILALSNSSISGSTTTGNSAEGGGVFNAGNGTLTLTDDSIFGNTLSGNGTAGGGICNFGTATLSGVTVSGNILSGGDGSGGGIYNQGTMSLVNCTIANNSAPGGNVSGQHEGGGGITNDVGGNITLHDVTVADNTVSGAMASNSFGGGIFNADVAGNFTLANSIVAGDTIAGVSRDADGNFTSLGDNLVGAIDGNSSGWIASDLTGSVATPFNANLGVLANNGGPTQTLLPQTGSPAIDAGNNALIPSGIVTDQRGLPRIYNTTVDIGAVEVQPATVTILATPLANQIANPGNNQTFNLGSFTETGATAPYSVDVSWGDGTSDTIIGNVATAGNIPAAAHTYQGTGNDTVSITVTDAGNHTSPSATFSVTVVAPGPASIAGTVYSDTNGNGIYNPADTGIADVMVYLDTNNNGILDAGEISANTDVNGNFSFGNLAAGNYTVREVVPGDYAPTGPAAGNISVTLISGEALTGQMFLDAPTGNATPEAVYRLYSPVTLEHLYTTDPNEYNTLESYVGTWNGEGEVFNEYSGPATVGGVTDEPYYRLYNTTVLQHLWTTDLNEYTVLATEGWNQEGIVGYVFPGATGSPATALASVPNSQALYRLMAPKVHVWTTSLNEYDTLQTEGWTGEGIIGYVVA